MVEEKIEKIISSLKIDIANMCKKYNSDCSFSDKNRVELSWKIDMAKAQVFILEKLFGDK